MNDNVLEDLIDKYNKLEKEHEELNKLSADIIKLNKNLLMPPNVSVSSCV